MDFKEYDFIVKDLTYIQRMIYPYMEPIEYLYMLNIDYDKTQYERRYYCRVCQCAFTHATKVRAHLKTQKHMKNQMFLINMND